MNCFANERPEGSNIDTYVGRQEDDGAAVRVGIYIDDDEWGSERKEIS